MFHICINICPVQSETLDEEHTVLRVLGKGVLLDSVSQHFPQLIFHPSQLSPRRKAFSVYPESSKKIFLQYRNTRLALEFFHTEEKEGGEVGFSNLIGSQADF